MDYKYYHPKMKRGFWTSSEMNHFVQYAKSHSLNEVAYNPWSFNIELFPNFLILE
jgi:hypothetical protein